MKSTWLGPLLASMVSFASALAPGARGLNRRASREPSGAARRRRRCLRGRVLALMVVLPVSAFPQRASGQEADANRVAIGDTVRVMVTPSALEVRASFLGWERDAMLLDVPGLEDPWAVSVFQMHRMEVLTHRTNREGLRHGLVLGGAGGLFLGAAVGAALNAFGVTHDPARPPAQIVTAGIRGAWVGTVVGALAGGVYWGRRPGRGWVRLELPAARSAETREREDDK